MLFLLGILGPDPHLRSHSGVHAKSSGPMEDTAGLRSVLLKLVGDVVMAGY